MLSIRRPSDAEILSLLERESGKPFSYPSPGMTRGELPPGFLVNFARVELGSGEAAFQAGVRAVRAWAMYDLGWTRLVPERPLVEEGSTFATLAQAYGLWTVNIARVAYVLDDPWQAGFAIGTLAHHVEGGEERFLVKRLRDGRVRFELLAYTSLRHWLAKAASPLSIRLLRRFGREACAGVLRRIHHRDTETQR